MPNGHTTFSGTKYQAEITALYLGRLLDSRLRGGDQMVVEVRPEADAEAEVDDILVRFKDRHTEWMQIKENLDKSGKPWEKMWHHFNDQLSQVQNARDRIVLILGNPQDWSKDLRVVCERAASAKDGQEWNKEEQLSVEQRKLQKSIYKLLYQTQPEDTNNEDLVRLYDLMRRIDVRVVEADRVRVDQGPNWMPASNLKPLDLYDKLLAIVWAAAEKGKSIDHQWITEKLANEQVKIYTTSQAGEVATLWTVPYRSLEEGFVGRREDLDELHRQLEELGQVGITGMGGLGKTQLAVEYAHKHQEDYPHGVFWLNAANPLLGELAALAETLGLADRETARDQAAFKVRDYLKDNLQALVVFDNLNDPASLNLPIASGFIPAELKCRLLFTTRQRDYPDNFHLFEIKVLLEEASLRLLLRGRPSVLDPAHPEHEDAKRICTLFGGLPLALTLAAAYLGKFANRITLNGYLELLKIRGGLKTLDLSVQYSRLSEKDLATLHSTAMHATLETQVQAVENPDAMELFLAAGQLPQASWIPIGRLGLLCGLTATAEFGEVSLLDLGIEDLHAVSLVEELAGDQLRLHPLVHDCAARLGSEKPGLRLQMAGHLAGSLGDVKTLETQIELRGVDAVLEDLILGQLLLQGAIDGGETLKFLTNLERLLEPLRDLRYLGPASCLATFLQQFVWQARTLGIGAMATESAALLEARRLPYLGWRWGVLHAELSDLRVPAGHTSWVNAVALTPDGKRTVSASDDSTLRVWDLETGQEQFVLEGHTKIVNTVVLTPDGKRAVSASGDRTLRVWDLETERALSILEGHTGAVNAVVLTLDGKKAVSASSDGTLRVWDLGKGEVLHTLEGHTDRVEAVALTPDGVRAVSASWDNTLRVWDLETGQEVSVLEGHTGWVNAVALTPDGKQAVSASLDCTLQVWDLETGQEQFVLEGHTSEVIAVALSPDGRRAVSASGDRTLRVWDLETERALSILEGHSEGVRAVALTPDGKRAVSISWGSTLHVWNLETGGELLCLNTEPSKPSALITDGENIVAGDQAGNVYCLRFWEPKA